MDTTSLEAMMQQGRPLGRRNTAPPAGVRANGGPGVLDSQLLSTQGACSPSTSLQLFRLSVRMLPCSVCFFSRKMLPVKTCPVLHKSRTCQQAAQSGLH